MISHPLAPADSPCQDSELRQRRSASGSIIETTIRSTESISQAQEWALALTSSAIPHRLESQGHLWRVVIPDTDVTRAREALDTFDAEESGSVARAARGAARPASWYPGIAAGMLMLAGFAITGSPAT